MPGPPPLQQMGVLPGTGAPMPSLSLAPSAIAQAPPQPPPPPQIQVKALHFLDHGKKTKNWVSSYFQSILSPISSTCGPIS